MITVFSFRNIYLCRYSYKNVHYNIVNKNKQLKYPSNGSWVKLWYVYMMKFYATIKRIAELE